MTTAQIRDQGAIRAFCLGGNARFTLVSTKTGARFTFRVTAPKQSLDGVKTCQEEATIWFVSLLTGSDNESAFTYFGNIKLRPSGHVFEVGRKSRIAESAPSVKAFAWFWRLLQQGELPGCLEFWHEGKCCRCGRALTVPSSIESGIGPECAQKAGAF